MLKRVPQRHAIRILKSTEKKQKISEKDILTASKKLQCSKAHRKRHKYNYSLHSINDYFLNVRSSFSKLCDTIGSSRGFKKCFRKLK